MKKWVPFFSIKILGKKYICLSDFRTKFAIKLMLWILGIVTTIFLLISFKE